MLKKLFKEEGFDKPIKVIESCVNLKQLESAKNYVKLFINKKLWNSRNYETETVSI